MLFVNNVSSGELNDTVRFANQYKKCHCGYFAVNVPTFSIL
ncbi:hypothetical protein [Chitinophaga sp. HK235]|nr:hypothetical protein [Chitinophaga sp. HK235]